VKPGAIALVLTVSTSAGPALADCKPGPDWRAPAPREAFRAADAVVHARIVSTRLPAPGRHEARIKIIKVLKGSFAGDSVYTVAASECGLADAGFKAGEEYVFFLYGKSGFVSRVWQPAEPAAQVLEALTIRER
jgi:hypothetical protein